MWTGYMIQEKYMKKDSQVIREWDNQESSRIINKREKED